MGNTPFKDDWFRQGNMQALSKWLEVNDVNKQNEFGNTVGHWSCWHNQPQMLKLSIEKGLFVNVANNGVNTPLHLAAYRKSIKCVEFLLQSPDCNVEVVNASGYTARDIAERKKSDEIVQMIDEYKRTHSNGTTAGAGSAEGQTPSPGTMVASASTDSVASNSSAASDDDPLAGKPALYRMLREMLPPAVPDSVVQGEVDKLEAEMIYEPSQLADFTKADLQGFGLKSAAVAKLMQWESWTASKKKQAEEKKAAAEEKKNGKPAKVKRKRSLFGSFRKSDKKRVFKPWKEHWFERGQHKKFERWVSKYKNNINWQNVHGNTAAHWAAWNKQLPMLVLCAENGADFAMKNNGDNTPLHLAAYRNAVSCVQFLLARGAPWDVQNQTKETPRDVASRMNYTSVCRFIDMHTGVTPVGEDDLVTGDGDAEEYPSPGAAHGAERDGDGGGDGGDGDEAAADDQKEDDGENKQARLVQIQSLYLELDDGSQSEMSEMSEYSISEAPGDEELPPINQGDGDEGPAPPIPYADGPADDDDDAPPPIPDGAGPPIPDAADDDDGPPPSLPPLPDAPHEE